MSLGESTRRYLFIGSGRNGGPRRCGWAGCAARAGKRLRTDRYCGIGKSIGALWMVRRLRIPLTIIESGLRTRWANTGASDFFARVWHSVQQSGSKLVLDCSVAEGDQKCVGWQRRFPLCQRHG